MSKQSATESILEQELVSAADDGSALLAVLGLERVLGRRSFRISESDIARAANLSRVLIKRYRGFLAEEGFKPVHLNLTDKSFFELRDLVVEGLDEARLAELLAVIADEEFKVVFATTATAAVEFLKARIPPAPVRVNPSEFLVAGFMRAWRTISNPMTVIDDIEMGCLSTDQIVVLQAVYPGLYELFASALMTVLVEKSDEEISYRKLKQISVLLQQSLVPENLKGILAQSFAQAEQPDVRSSANAPDLSAQTRTKNQKLEFQLK